MHRHVWHGVAMCALACAVAVGATDSASGDTRTSAAAPCRTSGLVVWLDTRGNATAGSVYYTLKFTNQSGVSCVLAGYPGVSAVDLRGDRLGSAASRNPPKARLVTLADGATASAELRITLAGNFPASACHRVAAAGLRVYPPNQAAFKLVPLPFDACSKSGPLFLSVKAVST